MIHLGNLVAGFRGGNTDIGYWIYPYSTRYPPDLDTQYPILWDWVWDWVLKYKINRVLDNPNGYWVLPEMRISNLLF